MRNVSGFGCFASVLAIAAFAGCGGSDTNTNTTPTASESAPPASSAPPPAASSVATVTTPPPALPPVDVVPGTPAAPPDKAPTIAFTAPTKDQLIASDKANDFQVKIDLKGWDIPTDHRHVHLILDNKPYTRIDDVTKMITLKDLAPQGIGDGQHVLVAFPSRGTHESVKPIGKAAPLAVVSFYVGKAKVAPTWKPTDPMLIFSRPKGKNDGPPPAEGILVDFYLSNVELGDGKDSIDASVTGPGLESGKSFTIKEWKPWRITNVRDGEYTIRMTLKDKDGKPVPGAWNDDERKFTVDQAAQPDHPH